jgi:LPS O-antigen subunit length determinant protein (WzzB/FepE family)
MYQDLQGIYESVLNELAKAHAESEALERKIKSLKADVDAWKGLSKERYHKMVDANLENKALEAALEERIDIIRDDRDEKIDALSKRVKWHEETREVLLKVIAHQGDQLEFLR